MEFICIYLRFISPACHVAATLARVSSAFSPPSASTCTWAPRSEGDHHHHHCDQDQHHPHTLIDIAIIIIINVYMGQGYIELFFFGISNKIKNRSKLRNNSPFEYNFIIKLPLPAYFINKRPFQDQFLF